MVLRISDRLLVGNSNQSTQLRQRLKDSQRITVIKGGACAVFKALCIGFFGARFHTFDLGAHEINLLIDVHSDRRLGSGGEFGPDGLPVVRAQPFTIYAGSVLDANAILNRYAFRSLPVRDSRFLQPENSAKLFLTAHYFSGFFDCVSKFHD